MATLDPLATMAEADRDALARLLSDFDAPPPIDLREMYALAPTRQTPVASQMASRGSSVPAGSGRGRGGLGAARASDALSGCIESASCRYPIRPGHIRVRFRAIDLSQGANDLGSFISLICVKP